MVDLFQLVRTKLRTMSAASACFICIAISVPFGAEAQTTAFRQAVAEAAARDEALAAFYRGRTFDGVWTGEAGLARRNALMAALSDSQYHGLPAARYDVDALMGRLASAGSASDLGTLEVELTKLYLQYARDVSSGVVVPRNVDSGIVRQVSYAETSDLLAGLMGPRPTQFLRSLPPSTPEYGRLVAAKMRLVATQEAGGWGPTVNASKLEVGATGPDVIALRDRLTAMGHMDRSLSATYDEALIGGVRAFQAAHGLAVDGDAGPATLEEINVPITRRIQSILVAMERERWFNRDRGDRHIWVNLTDFSAQIIDQGEITFQTRSVIGAVDPDRVTPEFSDVMEYMVINPSWYVPRSIVTKEYLPQLQRNPAAAGHMVITDSRGRVVNRNAVDFSQYTARTFPFAMRQPPSSRNALGLVKFMFPNKYNIYLHDTPAKSLFGREVRAFSHGCIRLNDPFDFAYALLAAQTDDPVGLFQSRLNSGKESSVRLDEPVPVHLIYRTAFTNEAGQIEFRRDVYGRDRRIWSALSREGVVVPGLQG
ncbi:MAG: L,D-transpeptidase family protein [Pseudomonadota bacterium]